MKYDIILQVKHEHLLYSRIVAKSIQRSVSCAVEGRECRVLCEVRVVNCFVLVSGYG